MGLAFCVLLLLRRLSKRLAAECSSVFLLEFVWIFSLMSLPKKDLNQPVA